MCNPLRMAAAASLAAVGVLSLVGQASAGAIQLFSRNQLNGPSAATVAYTTREDLVASPYTLEVAGQDITFSVAVGGFLRRVDQEVTFIGDFEPWTSLLYTNNNNSLGFDGVTTLGGGGRGPMEITFGDGVEAVGLNAQTQVTGYEVFTFVAFNELMPLGAFVVTGTASDDRQTSNLVFLGVRATAGDVITRLTLSSLTFQNGGTTSDDFAIGPVTVELDRRPAPVPEPGTAGLIIAGTAALASLRLSSRRSSRTRS